MKMISHDSDRVERLFNQVVIDIESVITEQIIVSGLEI